MKSVYWVRFRIISWVLLVSKLVITVLGTSNIKALDTFSYVGMKLTFNYGIKEEASIQDMTSQVENSETKLLIEFKINKSSQIRMYRRLWLSDYHNPLIRLWWAELWKVNQRINKKLKLWKFTAEVLIKETSEVRNLSEEKPIRKCWRCKRTGTWRIDDRERWKLGYNKRR